MLRDSADTLFMNITIYDYLWNYRCNLVKKIQEIAPALVPTNNSGVLYQVKITSNVINLIANLQHFFSFSCIDLRRFQ